MHNANDNRCRYTLGARRCPAIGTQRVGDWWVCDLHVYWAGGPGDPDRAEDGKAALEVQEFQRDKRRDGSAEAERRRAVAVRALGELRALLSGSAAQRPEPFAWARDLAVPLYGRRRRELEADGVQGQAAHERALGEVAVEVARHAGAHR